MFQIGTLFLRSGLEETRCIRYAEKKDEFCYADSRCPVLLLSRSCEFPYVDPYRVISDPGGQVKDSAIGPVIRGRHADQDVRRYIII